LANYRRPNEETASANSGIMARRPPSKRSVVPIRLDGVWLRIDAKTWTALPPNVKERLRAGTARTARIRELIARAARVSVMPPVEVVGETWLLDQGIVEGCALPLRVKDSFEWGVQLPAHVAIQEDDSVLRAVLVHEFAHCFHYIADIVHRIDRGMPLDEIAYMHDPTKNEDDRALLVNPRDWFGEIDAGSFAYHADMRLNTADESISEIAEYLPMITPELKYKMQGSLSFDNAIADHVRSIRQKHE